MKLLKWLFWWLPIWDVLDKKPKPLAELDKVIKPDTPIAVRYSFREEDIERMDARLIRKNQGRSVITIRQQTDENNT